MGLAHLRGRRRLGNQAVERDRVALGEDPDHVLRLPGTRSLPPAEDAEVVGARLDHVPPFAKVSVDKIRPEEVRVRREPSEQALEGLAGHLNPPAVDEVQGFDGNEQEPVATGTAVPLCS